MTSDDRPGGFLRALMDLLADLDERSERTRSGSWTDGRTSVRYSVSVGGLDDAIKGTDTDHDAPVITTRPLDDGLLVVADIPDSREGDVSVDLDGSSRVARIMIGDDVVGEVPLDDAGWTVADFSVNNDVLEVRLTHDH